MMRTDPMPRELAIRLIMAGRETGEHEIVGFIMSDWSLVFMPNVSDLPGRVEVDELALLDFYAEFPQPMGMFHSHPSGREEPSDVDEEHAPVGIRYWIITLDNVIEWDMNNGSNPKRISGSTKVLAPPNAASGSAIGPGDSSLAGKSGAGRCVRCGSIGSVRLDRPTWAAVRSDAGPA